MKHIDSDYLSRGIETLDLEDFEPPQMLDRLLMTDGEDYRENSMDSSISGWLESAEKWNRVPRRAAFIPDYFDLNEDISEKIEYRLTHDSSTPALDGASLAWSAIRAQREASDGGFGAIIGLPVSEFNSDANIHQVLGPAGREPVKTPEWLQNDDWYSELEEDDYVGVVIDDDTAYARHIRDNTQELRGDYSIESKFWEGFDETLENYTSLI